MCDVWCDWTDFFPSKSAAKLGFYAKKMEYTSWDFLAVNGPLKCELHDLDDGWYTHWPMTKRKPAADQQKDVTHHGQNGGIKENSGNFLP